MSTPTRSVRIDEVWDRASEAAEAQGETVTDVIRRALKDYAARWEADKPEFQHYLELLEARWPELPQDEALAIIRSGIDSLGRDGYPAAASMVAYARGWMSYRNA